MADLESAADLLFEKAMEDIQGHIVALGGGGFSMESDNTLLDDFILSLVPKPLPRVCFVPTASADSVAYTLKFYRAFSGRAIATDLTIFDPPATPRRPARTSDMAAFVAEQDIVYVGGVNTANLLAIWRTHGLDKVLYDAWRGGTVLCGISAGMLCWFQDGLTDSFGGFAPLKDGLGFLEASACPHYDGERERQILYQQAIEAGMANGYAADDYVALHFQGKTLVEAVSSRPEAAAYRVEQGAEPVRLSTRYLG